MIIWITAALLPGFPIPLFASAIGENDPDLSGSMIKAFSILFLILALLFVSFYLGRGPLKEIKKRIGLKNGNDIIRVIDISHIAPKKSIGVVDVAGHLIVVGITANDIKLLARLDTNNQDGIEI